MPLAYTTQDSSTTQADDRLAELMVYLAQKCAGDPRFGATKLNKILFFADFLSYQQRGKPVTGVEYMKLPQGPAPRHLVPVKTGLVENDALQEIEMMFHGRRQKRVVAKRPPNLSLFSADDIAFVDGVIEYLNDYNGTQVSELSHNMPAWKVANLQETIPYHAVFLSCQMPSDADFEWARGEALS